MFLVSGVIHAIDCLLKFDLVIHSVAVGIQLNVLWAEHVGNEVLRIQTTKKLLLTVRETEGDNISGGKSVLKEGSENLKLARNVELKRSRRHCD